MAGQMVTIIVSFLLFMFTSMIYILEVPRGTQSQDDCIDRYSEICIDTPETTQQSETCVDTECNTIETTYQEIYTETYQETYTETYKETEMPIEIETIIEEVKVPESIEETTVMIETEVITEESSTAYNEPIETEEIYHSNEESIYPDLADAYYGRLYIPELSINVALYYSYDQYVTDRPDSANIFCLGTYFGYTIADHNYQEFAKLFDVEVGMKGYIINKYEHIGRLDIECVDVFAGYNDGHRIVDSNGVDAMGVTNYMMYTCLDDSNSHKVLVCLWDIVK